MNPRVTHTHKRSDPNIDCGGDLTGVYMSKLIKVYTLQFIGCLLYMQFMVIQLHLRKAVTKKKKGELKLHRTVISVC